MFRQHRWWALLITSFAVAFAIGASSPSLVGQARADEPAGKIVTAGRAAVAVPPDQATVVIGVSVVGKTARDAQAEVAKRLTGVTAALIHIGIPEKSIQTRTLGVGPEYDYDEGKQTLRGYRATHDLHVKVAALDTLGKVLDATVAAGATQVSDVQFELKDSTQLQVQMLQEAVRDARRKAEALAVGAGVKIVRITRIQDQSAPVTALRTPMAGLKALAAERDETQLAAGEIQVQADVEVEFAF